VGEKTIKCYETGDGFFAWLGWFSEILAKYG
jgi:hypothetical protein